MQLANPYALLLLGLIPILILIHSLKPRPQMVEVTSLFLWEEALRERSGGFRIHRIIRNLPLLLQILAVLLAVLALANPIVPYRSVLQGDVILVLDTSASMRTVGPMGIRFDMAKREALKLIDQIPEGRKMLVLEAGSKPGLKSPFSGDRKRLKQVIQSIQPTDAPGDMKKALYLAMSFMDPERNDKVLFITDGASQDFERGGRLHSRMEPVLIPGGSQNVGITKFEFRRCLGNQERYEILLEIKNFNPNAILCPLRLSLDGKTLLTRTVGLKAGEKKLLIFPYSGLMVGVAEVILDLEDDFPTDNRARAVLRSSEDIWVLLVSKGNFFLEKLLGAYPQVKVNSLKEIIPSSWTEQSQRHDIVILDRISPPFLGRGNYLLIRSLAPPLPLATIGEVKDPPVLAWDRKSPLMEGLDLRTLRVEGTTLVKAENPVRVLLESPDTGMIYSYEDQGIRAVYMGFDLTRSDLPLRVAFPVMMSNIFRWLYPDKLGFSSRQVQAGGPFPIYLEPGTKEFSVRTPDGKWETLQAKGNPYHYSNTDQTGIYTVAEGNRQRSFAVNLVDERESDIRGPQIRSEDKGREAKPGVTVRAFVPLWPYLLFGGCLLLFLEWYVWCRKPS